MTSRDIGKRRNLLKRYRSILNEFNKYDANIIPITTIHREYIYPKFFISRDTLYTIFNTDIEKELENLKAIQAKMPTLFD